MDADHQLFAELAVGHVLGGLSASDQRRFQSHLRGCPACRTRVAELRDIADDLAEAEVDERSRSPLRTELDSSEDGADETTSPGVAPTRRIGVGQVALAAVIVLFIAVGVLFWNLHLRTSVAGYEQLLDAQSEALLVLARGTPLPAEYADGVTGVVATDGEMLAFTIAGFDAGDGEVVSVWTVDDQGDSTEVTRAPADLVRRGGLASAIELDEVHELLVTLERTTPGGDPEGDVLLRSTPGTDGDTTSGA